MSIKLSNLVLNWQNWKLIWWSDYWIDKLSIKLTTQMSIKLTKIVVKPLLEYFHLQLNCVFVFQHAIFSSILYCLYKMSIAMIN